MRLKLSIPILFVVLILISCTNVSNSNISVSPVTVLRTDTIPKEPLKFISSVSVPEGFERVEVKQNSFGEYLRDFPFKQSNNIVYLYNGEPKGNQDVHIAVLDIDVGTQDLQQCADAVMRLRAEYLFKQEKYDEIHFNFSSGDEASYSKYAQGYRAVVKNNQVSWMKIAAEDHSYNNFRKYLDLVFMYAGTRSLNKELKNVIDIDNIQIGDVFIQTGNPYGHAVIVMDIVSHKGTGRKLFILAQSYMPAQEIHLLKNPNDPHISPWYDTDFENELVTPEWVFEKKDLKRF